MTRREEFAAFVRAERAAGGPDPQLPVVALMGDGESWESLAWRGCVYASVHHLPVAQGLWETLPWERVSRLSPDEILAVVTEKWEGVRTRLERRAVRRPVELARCLYDFACWVPTVRSAPWYDPTVATPQERYEDAWEDVQRVHSVGRYIALKLLEFLRAHADAPIELSDMRPRGGWSPRAALAFLEPRHEAGLNGDDSPANLRLVNAVAYDVWLRLANDGLELSWFALQVLLCEFKESWESRRFYPGRSYDEELEHYAAVHEFWGLGRQMFDARARHAPPEHLGELQGWDGGRPDLGPVLREHGYVWSDLQFDYWASRADLARPVRR